MKTPTDYRLQALVVGFIIASIVLIFLHDPGTGDTQAFLSWARTLTQHGPFSGYRLIKDYPPLAPCLLWLAVTAGHLAGLSEPISLKLAIAGFETAAGLIVMQWLRSPVLGLTFFLLLAPFGTMLGYIDAFYVPFVLLLVICLDHDHPSLALMSLGLAMMTKWQPAMLAPFVALYTMARSQTLRALVLTALPTTALVVVVLLLFGPVPVISALSNAAHDPFYSGYALNLNWLLGGIIEWSGAMGEHLSPDGTIVLLEPTPSLFHALSRGLFLTSYIGCLLGFLASRRSVDDVLLCMLVGYLAYFSLNTGVHENHLLLGLVLGFVCLRRRIIDVFQFACLAVVALIDAPLFYGLNGAGLGFSRRSVIDPSVLVAILDIVTFALLAATMLARTLRSPASPTSEQPRRPRTQVTASQP